jgi:hypothetical protein
MRAEAVLGLILGRLVQHIDQVAARTAQIHGLSAWTKPVGEFDDRHPVAAPGQPEGQCRSRDSGSADQDGRLRHGRQGNR